MADLKPWPGDCVPIIVAPKGEEIRDYMVEPRDGTCRDCGRAVCFDGYTYATAEKMPARRGRPIVFLCLGCFPAYEHPDVTAHRARVGSIQVDHRGGAGVAMAEAEGYEPKTGGTCDCGRPSPGDGQLCDRCWKERGEGQT